MGGAQIGEYSLLVTHRELDPVLVVVAFAASLYPQTLSDLIIPRRRCHRRLVLILQLGLEIGNLSICPPKLSNDRVLRLPLGLLVPTSAAAGGGALLLTDRGRVRD